MPTIHIATPPDGQKQELDESEVYPKWQAGDFPEGSLYWTMGMAGWEPLAGFIDKVRSAPPVATPPPIPAAPPVDPNVPLNPYASPVFASEAPAQPLRPGEYVFYKDPRVLTHVLIVFLGLGMLVDVIGIIGSSAQLSLLSRPYTLAEGESNDARQRIIGVANMLVYFTTVVIFGMWIYRVARNVHAFGATGLQDKPGWAVGWYFIPFANLVRPYRAMKEIWKASADPMDWTNQPGSPILVIWWTFWIINNIGANIALRIPRESISDLQGATIIDIIVAVISVILAIVAIVLVKTLTQRQETLVARSAE